MQPLSPAARRRRRAFPVAAVLFVLAYVVAHVGVAVLGLPRPGQLALVVLPVPFFGLLLWHIVKSDRALARSRYG